MKIRYTRGPDDLTLGRVALQRDQWQEVDAALAEQALLPDRVAEYGFEAERKPASGKNKTTERGE